MGYGTSISSFEIVYIQIITVFLGILDRFISGYELHLGSWSTNSTFERGMSPDSESARKTNGLEKPGE